MRQALKSLLALLVAATVMMVIRAYVFTIYTVPVRLDDNVGKGDRVGVLHWLCSSPDSGDIVVYGDTVKTIGRIKAMPGDSITVKGTRYRIPEQCCKRCKSTDCHTFLIDTGHGETLIQKHEVLGKAWKLF